MLSLLLVAGLVATSTSASFLPVRGSPSPECPEGWVLIERTCFLVADASGTWDEGQSFCNQRGAFLATVSTQAQQTALKTILSRSVWIGLIYLKEDNDFGWADGSRYSYTSWHDGEPNNNGNVQRNFNDSENCVEIRDVYGHMWNDENCDENRRFLCSKPAKDITPPPAKTTPVAFCEAGWLMFKDTICYSVSNYDETWSGARSHCRFRGGELAIITSQEEHNFLAERVPDFTWIGLNDMVEEGMFFWVDGTKPVYTNWQEDEPNNKRFGRSGDEDCVEMVAAREYKWNDCICSAERPFVCQKAPSVRHVSFNPELCQLP